VKNRLDVNESDDHALEFVLHLSRLFSVSVSLIFPCTAHAVHPERLSNNVQRLRRISSDIYTEFDAVPL
jgi:hypothetical protein